MSFNKAKEEHRWTIWKNTEEKLMRQLGVSEDAIEQLRVYDWVVFNSDRRYYRRLQDGGTYLESVAESDTQTEIKTAEELLDSIDSEMLYQTLRAVDEVTLQIALMKSQGYSVTEITVKLDLTPKAVYRRMDRLKEKLKKVL